MPEMRIALTEEDDIVADLARYGGACMNTRRKRAFFKCDEVTSETVHPGVTFRSIFKEVR